MLKPLARAVADGDHVYAVIRATAVNHGGKGASLTAPNPEAQAELYLRALRTAKLSFSDLDYIEVHGTGTALGDPVEVNGLKLAASRLEPNRRNGHASGCGLGTVKSNIGHLEPAAGIAGLIKVLLALREEELPPTLHVRDLNPHIRLQDTPFHILTERRPWPSALKDGSALRPRRAGISSFGFGGVNAHLIVEEFHASPDVAPSGDQAPELFLFSARDRRGLHESARRFLQWLGMARSNSRPLPTLRDVAFTLQAGREAHEERLALVATSLQDLTKALEQYLAGHAQSLIEGSLPSLGQSGIPTGADDALYRELFVGRRLDDLARLWAQGADVPWEQLYLGTRPHRLSLPTYPFARERHWLPYGHSSVGPRSNRALANPGGCGAGSVTSTCSPLAYGFRGRILAVRTPHPRSSDCPGCVLVGSRV